MRQKCILWLILEALLRYLSPSHSEPEYSTYLSIIFINNVLHEKSLLLLLPKMQHYFFFLASNSNNDIPKCLYYCLRTLYKGLVYSFHPCNWKNYTLAQLLTGVVLIKSIVFILKHSLPG